MRATLLAADGTYRKVMVRVIELARSRLSRSLGPASKLNRDPAFIRQLIEHGEARAAEFLDALAFDATLVSRPPFPESGPIRGADHVRRFVREHFGGGLAIDLTRKQVAGSRVTWTARADPRTVLGAVHAEFRDGRITSLELGASDTL